MIIHRNDYEEYENFLLILETNSKSFKTTDVTVLNAKTFLSNGLFEETKHIQKFHSDYETVANLIK